MTSARNPPDALAALAENIRSDIVDVIRWVDNHSSRSLQQAIGPSELGDPCERKIAYRLVGVKELNEWADPLPAIVGTAVHAWLERAITRFQTVHHMDRWVTESTVQVDGLLRGHVDLYDRELFTVIDFKTVSPTKLKEWKSKGPSEQHIDQVNLYAMGMAADGEPVRYVSLIAIPRSGWLSDVRVWVNEYEPARAHRALARMYAIADKLIAMGDRMDFSALPAVPGKGCGFCPWYVGGDREASEAGCPGNAAAGVEKFEAGLVG